MPHLVHNRAELWYVDPLYKRFFSVQTLNWWLHKSRPCWNTVTKHKGAESHPHCRSCMGSQRDLRAAVIVYIHSMRAANQPAMWVTASVDVSVPEVLNVALNERRQKRKTVIYDKGKIRIRQMVKNIIPQLIKIFSLDKIMFCTLGKFIRTNVVTLS